MLSHRCYFIPDPAPAEGIRRPLSVVEGLDAPDLRGALTEEMALFLQSQGLSRIWLSNQITEADAAPPDIENAHLTDRDLEFIEETCHPHMQSCMLLAWDKDGLPTPPAFEMGMALSIMFMHLADNWSGSGVWMPPAAQTIDLEWDLAEAACLMSVAYPESQVKQRRRRCSLEDVSRMVGARCTANLAAAVDAAAGDGLTHIEVQVVKNLMVDDTREIEKMSYWRRSEEVQEDDLNLRYAPKHPEIEHTRGVCLNPHDDDSPDTAFVDDVVGSVALDVVNASPKDELRPAVMRKGVTVEWRWLVQVRTPLHAQYRSCPVDVKARMFRVTKKVLGQVVVETPAASPLAGREFMAGKVGLA